MSLEPSTLPPPDCANNALFRSMWRHCDGRRYADRPLGAGGTQWEIYVLRARIPVSGSKSPPVTMIRTWALFAVLISGTLIDVARGNDLVKCEPQRVTDDGRHWAYRIIDGRECWYPGRPGKPKNELYWGRATTPSARQTVDQPEPETETVPSECEPQRVTGDGHYWAYPNIDRRECREPGPAGKPKNALYWGRATTPSARQTVDQPEPETETVPSEPPSRLVAAPPEKPQIAEAMPAEWRASAADQLLAFTCCWPELEEPAWPPAWPLALLPLGLYLLWWIAKPRRELRAVRAGDAGRVTAHSRLHRQNGRDSIRERREVSAIGVVRERRSASRDNEHLSSRRRFGTGLDESATSLFVLPINEQQHVSLASLVDTPDPMPRPAVRGRLVPG